MAVAPNTPDDMKERIRRACTEITPQMLTEVTIDGLFISFSVLTSRGSSLRASSVVRPKLR